MYSSGDTRQSKNYAGFVVYPMTAASLGCFGISLDVFSHKNEYFYGLRFATKINGILRIPSIQAKWCAIIVVYGFSAACSGRLILLKMRLLSEIYVSDATKSGWPA